MSSFTSFTRVISTVSWTSCHIRTFWVVFSNHFYFFIRFFHDKKSLIIPYSIKGFSGYAKNMTVKILDIPLGLTLDYLTAGFINKRMRLVIKRDLSKCYLLSKSTVGLVKVKKYIIFVQY